MHIPWGWIKQRPHFLAEKLSQEFDVHVYDVEGLRNREHYKNKAQSDINIQLNPIYLTGHLYYFFRKSKFITWIYRLLFFVQIKNFKSYRYIWITNIIFYKFLEPILSPNQILIYDCMDDDLEFPHIKFNSDLSAYYKEIEANLLKRANIILFSAQYLSNKVYQRSRYDREKSIIINNAIELPNINHSNQLIPKGVQDKLRDIEENHPNILYIGTISEWFDFDLIKKASKQYPDIKWILFGPNEVEIPNDKNIIHMGTLQRQYIFDAMERADALVMPFKMTELIKSVNPVKLYEYIYSGKPVIAPLYGESMQFEPYVYLYKSEQDFINLCEKVNAYALCRKAPFKKCVEFVQLNTWDERMDYIKSIL